MYNFGVCGWFKVNVGGEVCHNYCPFEQCQDFHAAKKIAESLEFYEIKEFKFVEGEGYMWHIVESKTYAE